VSASSTIVALIELGEEEGDEHVVAEAEKPFSVCGGGPRGK
jgi:hypothetical protein